MGKARRALAITALVVVGVVFLAILAVFITTNTDWGRAKVRRFALKMLNGRIHGRAQIGHVGGNLLTGLELADFSIVDTAGAPFLTADTVVAHYALRSLLHQRIYLDQVRLVRPVVVLDRPPGGAKWNWKRIFASDKKTTTKSGPGFGDWIEAKNVTLVDGRMVVRTPWKGADTLTGPARDSVIAYALSDAYRKRVERVPGGFQQVMDFRHFSGVLPRARIADPDSADMLVAVKTLHGTAEMFRPPAAELRDVNGTFYIAKDSAFWSNAKVAMPGTRGVLSGAYQLDAGDMWLHATTDTVALADLRWLYPRLPSQGGGALDFRMLMAESKDSADFVAKQARVHLGESLLAGDFGLSLADSVRFHDTNLRFSGIDTRTIEQLVPNMQLPRRGTLTGRAALAGTPAALRLDADAAFDDTRSGTSRVAAVGEVGFAKGAGGKSAFHARDLRVHVYPVQVDLARIAMPTLPIGGTVSGRATLDGSSTRWLVGSADLVHQDVTGTSHVIGRGGIDMGARKSMDVDVRVQPLAMATVGRFVPALGLRGQASGTVRVRGPFDNLALRSDLRLPDGGEMVAEGRVDIASKEMGYDLATSMRVFNLNAVLAKGPATSLTMQATARGRGFKPATMDAAFAVDAARSRYDSLQFDTLHARVAIAGGVATVDSLGLASSFAHMDATGSFGLVAGRTGTLAYHVRIDSLSGLRHYLPSDTGAVTPRPARNARLVAQARKDSASVARATEVERAVTGAPGPVLKVDTVPAVPRDSLAGTAYAAGTVSGNVTLFDVRGRAAFDNLVVNGNSVRRGRTEYAVTNGGTQELAIAAGLEADSVQAGGFELDSIDARVSYASGPRSGRVELAVRQDTGVAYDVHADYALHLDHKEVHFRDLRMRFDTAVWASAGPGAVRWGTPGIQIEHVDLRHGPTGRIYVNGLLPTAGAMDVQLAITGLEVGNLVALTQGDVAASGVLSVEARMQGTRADPRLRGVLAVVNPTYRGAALPDLRSSFQYAGARLTAHADVVRGSANPMATADATVPVNLAMTGVTGPRFGAEPFKVEFVADSLPLDALPKFTDAVADIRGRLVGKVVVQGTKDHPHAVGALALDLGRARIVSTGVTWRDIGGSIRLSGDSVLIDSLVAHTGGGHGGVARLTGGVNIDSLTSPKLALHLAVNDALVIDNDLGRAHASANIDVLSEQPGGGGRRCAVVGAAARRPSSGNAARVGQRPASTHICGRAEILHGVFYLPEPDHKIAVSPGDPAVFAVMDTAVIADRELVPTQSPMLAHLRIDLNVGIKPGTFVRSRDGNLEIYTPEEVGDLAVHVNRARNALRLEGVVATERGEYRVAGRRFDIQRGSATFLGTADPNPILQIIGTRDIDLPGRETLQIRVVIGGTARNPRVTLESDAQPPISQSDLLSYLAFGRSSSSLLQQQGSSASGQGTSSGQLVGSVAALATRQMASVALGAAVQEFQTGTARQLGLDVFNITPADIPTELNQTGALSFLQGTEVEAGKYVTPQTFVAIQARPAIFSTAGSQRTYPGIRFEQRLPKGLRLHSTIEPRFRLREPSLAVTTGPAIAREVVGVFLILERRF